MPNPTPNATSKDDPQQAAIRVWRQLGLDGASPESISLLTTGHFHSEMKSLVYRLQGGGLSIVAKRGYGDRIGLEQRIYEGVLARLPVPTLRCYGCVEEDFDGLYWLVLDEATGSEYWEMQAEHRVIGARWLAVLHTAGQEAARAAQLPDHGPAIYLAHLKEGRKRLVRTLHRPSLGGDEAAVLNALVRQCTALESHWDRIDRFCRDMPQTIVHGDLARKNVRIRTGERGQQDLLVFDWEMAGWGPPLADLAQFTSNSLTPDLPVYWSAVRASWPSIRYEDVTRMAHIGGVFRLLASIAWESWSLKFDWIDASMSAMAEFSAGLEEFLPRVAEL